MRLGYEDLLAFIKDELAVDCSEILPDTPLFSSGLIDSFSLVSLMSFIEKEHGILIAPIDINLANFDTIQSILNYLERASHPDTQAALTAV